MNCFIFALLIVMICHFRCGYANIDENEFSEVFSCVTTDDFYDSTILTWTVDSLVECSVLCSNNEDCEAFKISRFAPFTCILHSRTLQSQSCLEYPHTDIRGFNNMNAQCLNGGTKQGSGCQCYYGYVGPRCEGIQRDCKEGKSTVHYGNTITRDIFIIHPVGAPSPFLVECWYTSWGTGRTYLMQRDGGNVDFNLPWADYKNGFGDLNSEYWLGLDKIHYVTNNNGNQRMTMEVKTLLPSNTYRHCKYNDFHVANETDGYAFDFASFNCKTDAVHYLEDCLTPMKGKRFTTLDVDNDDLGGDNCAQIHQGAWWFTGCGDCNPLGPLVKPSPVLRLSIPNESYWPMGIISYALTELEMYMN